MAIDLLKWWVAAQLVGLAGMPLAGVLLRGLPDRGFAYAKALGLLLTGYLAWLAAMLGLVPFGAPSLIASAVAVGALGAWRWRATAAPDGPPIKPGLITSLIRAHYIPSAIQTVTSESLPEFSISIAIFFAT